MKIMMEPTTTTILPNPGLAFENKKTLPWQVIVHNDPVNLMSYVTMVLQKVFGYSQEKATQLMLEVHHHGKSIVWSGEREEAELHTQKLCSFLLMTSMEQPNL